MKRQTFQKTLIFRLICVGIIGGFIFSGLLSPAALAQALLLPAPGARVLSNPAYMPVIMKGVEIHADNPLLFDFIMDTGSSQIKIDSAEFKTESQKLIKYFLAALTIKEDDLWVNLSPYEKDKIIPAELGKTILGRDMLAQDYILKQLTASLMYPNSQLGKTFWDRVYAKVEKQFGATDIPVDTFNKVWIVAEHAKVRERDHTAFVVGSHLKVMLEEDYAALAADGRLRMRDQDERTGMVHIERRPRISTHSMAAAAVKEIIIPEIEKEVNEGKNFAPLRQMFYSMILASWYKIALKDALLNQVYSNKGKTGGVLTDDPLVKEKIYQQYLQAYQKGVFNYIKEDTDPLSEDTIARQYFSGGENMRLGIENLTITGSSSPTDKSGQDGDRARVSVLAVGTTRPAMQGWTAVNATDGKLQVNTKGEIAYTSDEPWVDLSGVQLVGVRHGHTNANRYFVLNGQANEEFLDSLNDKGVQQAQQTSQQLFDIYRADIAAGKVVVITSGLRRAQQTAQPFLDLVKRELGVNLPVSVEPGINEMDMGDATHFAYAQPPEALHAEMQSVGLSPRKMTGDMETTRVSIWPGGSTTGMNDITGSALASFNRGERYLDLIARQYRFLKKIAEDTHLRGKTVILFGHAIQMSALRIAMRSNTVARVHEEGVSVIQWRQLELKNGEVTRLENADVKVLSSPLAGMNPGGINFNITVDVTRERQGIDLKFTSAMIAEFQRGNFSGVRGMILRIVPIGIPTSISGR
ncbi:MAG: histidine phosphatase family protein [Candidatus Omnitrophica bacterium]|nr:histidine phosphatase family protein [Candidatus Omnitrophota bacterium]